MCAAETFSEVTEATHCHFVTIFTENCDITGKQMQKVISRWKPEEALLQVILHMMESPTEARGVIIKALLFLPAVPSGVAAVKLKINWVN